MRPDEHELNGPDDDGDLPPSRSQLRREALDVLKLAQSLVELSDAQLRHVPLPDDVEDEVRSARAVTQQIARKRQTQFLAKQLRRLEDAELEAIRASLEHDRDLARRETAQLHRVEIWRDRLINEGDEALNELVASFPNAERQHLRLLARQAKMERAQDKPQHAYRQLFQLVRELIGET